jgi:DNA-binding response OmpR family regulator
MMAGGIHTATVQNLNPKLRRDVERYRFLLRNISNPTLITLLKEMIAEVEAQLATLDVQRWRTASSSAGPAGSGQGPHAFVHRLETATPISPLSQIGGWQLDPRSKSIALPTGKRVGLTKAEFELLLILLTHHGQVLSRDELMMLSQRRSTAPGERTVDVLINRLRRKIEINPRMPAHIKTVRNMGYIFELEPIDT